MSLQRNKGTMALFLVAIMAMEIALSSYPAQGQRIVINLKVYPVMTWRAPKFVSSTGMSTLFHTAQV
ncbi:hypothetical protein ACP4OV_029287 [Aristida adscensionis]